MKRLPRYSLRDLFVITGVVALTLGSLQWVHRLLSIDPASETVTCNDQPASVAWTEIPWDGERSGIAQPHRFIASANPTLVEGAKDVEQRLFTIDYADYFGRPTFAASVRIEGWHTPDWSEYLFNVLCVGGGCVDGGGCYDYEFNAATRCLTIHVRQHINSKRIAKEATLRFVHDGHSFRRE